MLTGKLQGDIGQVFPEPPFPTPRLHRTTRASRLPVSLPLSHLRSSLVRVEALRPMKRAAQIPSSHSSRRLISASPPARMAEYWSQPLSEVSDVTCSSAADRAAQHATPSWFSLGAKWEEV
jgi:hypothetical protein